MELKYRRKTGSAGVLVPDVVARAARLTLLLAVAGALFAAAGCEAVKSVVAAVVPDALIPDDAEEKEEQATAAGRVPKASRAPVPKLAGEMHLVRESDTLWTIAEAWYRDNSLWPYIYLVNQHRIPDPDVLIPGTQILVPYLEGSAGQPTATDRRHLVTGYVRVYQAYKRAGRAKAPFFLWAAKRRDPALVRGFAGEFDPEDLKFNPRIAYLWNSLFVELGLNRGAVASAHLDRN